jgi:hypothetical protein
MKTITAIAAVAATVFAVQAQAQSMTCADYLKADKQMQSAMGGAPASTGNPQMDAQAKAMDAKLKAYCTKNPSVDVSKAMEAAMMQ